MAVAALQMPDKAACRNCQRSTLLRLQPCDKAILRQQARSNTLLSKDRAMTVGKASPRGFLSEICVTWCMPTLTCVSGVQRLQLIEATTSLLSWARMIKNKYSPPGTSPVFQRKRVVTRQAAGRHANGIRPNLQTQSDGTHLLPVGYL